MQYTKSSTQRVIFVFLGLWALMNFIQAGFVDAHADEAYYWMYAKFLDWGYFDHPPMVALFIRVGDALFHNTLGMRLLTVICSTFSIYLLWKILSRYAQNAGLFVLMFLSVVLFHVYGFITTPDAPLWFFAVLFFYVYQRYVAEDKLKWAFLLALVIAGLLYSKYHGILILFFTILSNLKLLRRPSFWGIVVVSCLVFLPHIWWQVAHGYPSFYYHFIDRSAAFYQFKFTTEYLLAQLALAGPLVGWFLYKSAAVLKTKDPFLNAVRFNFFGIFIFFLLSTFKGRVEAHWTLPGMLCLFMLAYIHLAGRETPKWFRRLAIVNIVLILLVRIVLIVPIAPLMKVKVLAYYFGNQKWASAIHEKAGDLPVIFENSFQEPSRYNYYTKTTKGFGYDSRYYRKNQYDIWPLEAALHHKTAYYVRSYDHGVRQDTITTDKGVYYGRVLDHVRMYQQVMISLPEPPSTWEKGKQQPLKLEISNPYAEDIYLGNEGEEWPCELEYAFKKGADPLEFKPVNADLSKVRIAAGKSLVLNAAITLPETPGKYKLIFSLRTAPFSGSRNSGMITVEVK